MPSDIGTGISEPPNAQVQPRKCREAFASDGTVGWAPARQNTHARTADAAPTTPVRKTDEASRINHPGWNRRKPVNDIEKKLPLRKPARVTDHHDMRPNDLATAK